MSSNRLAIVIATALVTAAVTWSMGWWGVVPVALVAGWLLREVRGIAGWTSMGTTLGWLLLLAADGVGGRFGALTHVLSGTIGLPSVALFALTLALPALLGWSAAALAAVATGVEPAATPPAAPR